jgi:hypothetical protein
MLINISILLIIVQHIFILLIYVVEDINPDIRKTTACLIRKRALELYSLVDDSELREMVEPVGGIETRINFLTLLNGQTDAWTHLFKSIDTNFLHSNTESLEVDFNGTDVHFKTYNK